MSLMLDLRFIRENPQAVRDAIRAKQLAEALEALERLLTTDEEHRLIRRDLEEKQAAHNASNKRIGELRRAGEDTADLMTEMAALSTEVKRLEEKERALQQSIDTLMLEIPNLPHESVPYGESEHDNVIAKEWGEKREFAFEPKPHWELMSERGWVDLEAGVKVTGAGFPVFRRGGARLVRALQAYFLDRLAEHGYEEVIPPLMVNTASATATGQLPDKEGQMYEVTDGFFLVPTSEVPVTNLYRDDIVDEALLPIKLAAYTACFRREAGSYGKDVRGLNRVHQFDKVEMVVFCSAADSVRLHEEMTRTAEGLLDKLGLRDPDGLTVESNLDDRLTGTPLVQDDLTAGCLGHVDAPTGCPWRDCVPQSIVRSDRLVEPPLGQGVTPPASISVGALLLRLVRAHSGQPDSPVASAFFVCSS